MSNFVRIPMSVDGVIHLHGGITGAVACGLVIYDRSIIAIMMMFAEGTDKDVDCMTCLVAEAREKGKP